MKLRKRVPRRLPRRAPERLVITITEAGELIGCKKSKAYELAESGELPTIMVGRERRVLVDALRAKLARKAEEEA
jgi:excisionase family DNA binding protein